MDISKEDTKRREFRNILCALAESQALKNSSERAVIYKRLEELYYDSNPKQKYRHFYSDIFIVLTQIHQQDCPGSIEALGQNILEIRKGYQAINKDENGDLIDISGNIKKLYDHVSLDIARINYSDKGDWKISGQEAISKLESRTNGLDEQINKFSQQMNNIEQKSNSMQREYIAILGIFSAIIIAFFSGIGFSSSVLAHMHEVSVYRLLLTIWLLGMVLFNILVILMYFIKSTISNKASSFNFIVVGIVSNVLFVLGFGSTLIAWHLQLLGCGNL